MHARWNARVARGLPCLHACRAGRAVTVTPTVNSEPALARALSNGSSMLAIGEDAIGAPKLAGIQSYLALARACARGGLAKLHDEEEERSDAMTIAPGAIGAGSEIGRATP